MTTKGIWKKQALNQNTGSGLARRCDCGKDSNCGGKCGDNCRCDHSKNTDTDSTDSSRSNASSNSNSSYSSSDSRNCELTFGERLIHFFIRVVSILTLPMHFARFVVLFFRCLFSAVFNYAASYIESECDSDSEPTTTKCHKKITTRCPTTRCPPCPCPATTVMCPTTPAPTTTSTTTSTTAAPTTTPCPCPSTTVCCKKTPDCAPSKKPKKDSCVTDYDRACDDISTDDLSVGPSSDADCEPVKQKKKHHNKKSKKN